MPDLTQLLLMGVGFLIYLVQWSLPKYINRKAENLAQKQDLEELTRIAANINSKFDRSNVVHRVQFEAEFRHYQDVWTAAHKTLMYFVRLYPVVGGLRTFTEQHFSEFVETQLSFAQALEACKPFIPDAVWKEFYDFEDLMIEAKARGLSAIDAQQHRKRANQAFERCAAAIKMRLSDTLVV